MTVPDELAGDQGKRIDTGGAAAPPVSLCGLIPAFHPRQRKLMRLRPLVGGACRRERNAAYSEIVVLTLDVASVSVTELP
jgi:hypothetical protein